MALLIFSLLPINIIHIEDNFKNLIYTVFNIEKQTLPKICQYFKFYINFFTFYFLKTIKSFLKMYPSTQTCLAIWYSSHLCHVLLGSVRKLLGGELYLCIREQSQDLYLTRVCCFTTNFCHLSF